MEQKRYSYSLKFLLLLFSFSVTCGAAEIALRLFNFKPALSSAWILDNEYRVLDDDLITIDRHYLDDAFYDSFRDQDSTQTIVALGDSFTAGIPVKWEDSCISEIKWTIPMPLRRWILQIFRW